MPPGRALSTAFRQLITAEVAEFVAGLRLQEVPPKVKAVARRHIVDSCGVIIAGRTERASALALKHACRMGGQTLAAPLAAFVGGVRGHVLDYDDTQLSTRPEAVYGLLTHPSVPVLSAALAVGHAEGSTGADLLVAFIAATESECRLCDAIDPRHYQSGFHSTGTVGTLGATLAAARMLKLDAGDTPIALGIGASSASGLRENFGTMTKSLHAGRAAQHGVEAAYLARAGWTAAGNVLEAERGFFSAFGGTFQPDAIHDRLGKSWYYLEPGVSIKPHPNGSLTHPAMWVFHELVEEHHLVPAQVEKVIVGTSSHMPNALIHHRPKDPLAAKFSMEYALAVLLARGRAGLREFSPEVVLAPDVQELIPRIELAVDPVAEQAGYHRMLTRITFRLKDGRQLFGEGEAGRGHPVNPMTEDEVLEKFEDCARWGNLPDAGTRIRDLVDNLEELDHLEELCQALLH